MQTIPYTTPDGIIDLVRKDEHDAIVAKLEADENTNLRQSLHDAKKLAGQLAEAASKCRHWHDTKDGVIISAESFWNLKDALAAYESAKTGSLPDPLAEAVKRMEAVPVSELDQMVRELWTETSEWAVESCKAIRARLIQAAKGEQP